MTTLSKTDLAAFRQADYIMVRLNASHPDGIAFAVKEQTATQRKPFAHDLEHTFPAEVAVGNYTKDDVIVCRMNCIHKLSLFRDSHAWTVINTLRVGDAVTFHFKPDYHSSQVCAKAGLHADALFLYVHRNDKRVATFELAMHICQDIWCRMCASVPASRMYQSDSAA